MESLQDSSHASMSETTDAPSRYLIPARLWAFRLSSLENLLDYKAARQEKSASIASSSPVSSGAASLGSNAASVEVLPRRRFRSAVAEGAFCFSMAVTQLLAEYMISGFAVMLPTLNNHFSHGAASDFWPATLLSLVLCAFLCPAARLSDMYGGYPIFMISVLWFGIWCLIAGFSNSLPLVDVCRAMQALAIAFYEPSSFALIGCNYPTGPRRNRMLGFYGACAPLGFFLGIFVAAALPSHQWRWYFWIAAMLSFVALIAAYISVPSDRADRASHDLTMDWAGTCAVVSGFFLVVYALSASSGSPCAWKTAGVLGPLFVGLVCSACAVYIEVWRARCPLLPCDFFAKRPVARLLLACIFFYGSFGTWLFTTTNHLHLAYGVTGLELAAWFVPMAAGGFLFSLLGTSILHIIPPTLVLAISGMAWTAAPLLLAFAKPSIGYWPFVFPAMLCATLGIDVTYAIASVVFSSVSHLRWQGLAGAVNSTAVNLGIAFSLAIAQVIQAKTEGSEPDLDAKLLGHRNAYLFSAASAAMGLLITALFVRIPRASVGSEECCTEPLDQAEKALKTETSASLNTNELLGEPRREETRVV